MELSEYEIVKRLGGGSISEAHLARDPAGQQVVLKVLREKLRDDRAYRILLLEEGELLASLKHIGLRRCLGLSESPPAQVLEHVDGAPLSGFLGVMRQEGTLFDVQRAFDVFEQVAAALGYLHERKICHLDVTPDNILIARDGRVVLADLARGKWPGRAATIEHAPIPAKIGYCAPELWKKKTLSTKTDVYQLGVVLWEILAGTPPELVALPRERKEFPALTRLEAHRQGLGAEVVALVETLTRRDPLLRPAVGDIFWELTRKARN